MYINILYIVKYYQLYELVCILRTLYITPIKLYLNVVKYIQNILVYGYVFFLRQKKRDGRIDIVRFCLVHIIRKTVQP